MWRVSDAVMAARQPAGTVHLSIHLSCLHLLSLLLLPQRLVSLEVQYHLFSICLYSKIRRQFIAVSVHGRYMVGGKTWERVMQSNSRPRNSHCCCCCCICCRCWQFLCQRFSHTKMKLTNRLLSYCPNCVSKQEQIHGIRVNLNMYRTNLSKRTLKV